MEPPPTALTDAMNLVHDEDMPSHAIGQARPADTHVNPGDLLPNIADLLLDAVFMVDVHGRIVYVSAACERIFGYAPKEMIGRTMIDMVVPEDRAKTWQEATQVMAGLPRVGFENRYIRKDGRHVHIMWSARWSEAHQLRIGVARDVTERKRAEAVQAATYAISEATQNATDLVPLFRDIHRIIVGLVPAAGFAVAMADGKSGQLTFPYQIDLYGNSSAMQETVTRLLCAEAVRSGQPSLLTNEMAASLADHLGIPAERGTWLAMPLLSRQTPVGALVLKSHRDTAYGEEDKELLQFVSTQVAIALERRALHAELQRAARYDDLTGLPNRRFIYERIASALGSGKLRQRHAALLYIDINGFKQINDVFGHAAGDALLRETARRLRHCVRDIDMVARMGGDEFVIFLDAIQTADNAAQVAEKIRSAFAAPMEIDGKPLGVEPSIGMALYPDHGAEVEQLLRHADQAMYADKRKHVRCTGG